MMRSWPLLFVLVLVACSSAPLATEQVQPTLTEPYYPLTTRTGVQDVDRVLEAVASDDPETLLSLIQFTEARCTHKDGLGGPPKCREGEVEGTSLQVFPLLSSEGSYLRQEELTSWKGIDVSRLYAVYEVSADVPAEKYFPSGKYVIVLIGKADQSSVALRVMDGGVVRVDDLLGPMPETANALLQREASRVILAPKK